MYSQFISLNASSYQNLFSSSSGVLVVPVEPSAVIYSQFNYVQGTAASGNSHGISLNRLQILNSMIDRLQSMKQDTIDSEKIEEVSKNEQTSMILNYASQMNDAVKAPMAGYTLTGLMPDAGNIVSFMA